MGTTALGNASPRSYIKRKSDERKQDDTTYRFRYVIPASSGVSVAKTTKSGYILQESNTAIGSTTAESSDLLWNRFSYKCSTTEKL